MKSIRIKIILLIIFVPLLLISQVKEISLEECIQLAKENNINVLNQKYTISKLESDIKIAKGLFLPDLNFSSSQGYNLGDSFNVSTGLGQRKSSSTLLGLSSSLVLYEGKANINKLKYSKLNREKNNVELESIRRELELLIANDYLQALLFKESINAAKSQLEVSEKQLKRVKILYKSGKITKKELLENQSLVEIDRKNIVEASTNYKNSLIKINEFLSFKKIENLAIQDIDVSIIENRFLLNTENDFSKNIDLHPSIVTTRLDMELQSVELAISKSPFYPKLSFNYEYRSGYYHILGEDDLVFNSATNQFESNGFLKQLNNNKSHNLTFSLVIPIFNRFINRMNFKKSKDDLEISKINYFDNKKNLINQLEIAYNDMLAAKAFYESNKLTLKFQKEVYRAADEQYKTGIINVYDFIDSRNRLLKAESDFTKSKFEYLFKIKIVEFYKI